MDLSAHGQAVCSGRAPSLRSGSGCSGGSLTLRRPSYSEGRPALRAALRIPHADYPDALTGSLLLPLSYPAPYPTKGKPHSAQIYGQHLTPFFI